MSGSTCEPSRESLLMKKEKYSAFNGATCLTCPYAVSDSRYRPANMHYDQEFYPLICCRQPKAQGKETNQWCGKHPEIQRVARAIVTDTPDTADSQVSHAPVETKTQSTDPTIIKDGATGRAARATVGTKNKKGRGES